MEFHAKSSGDPTTVVGGLLQEYDNLLNYITTRDATICETAMRGLGTDDELLVKILCNRSKRQIAMIDHQYRKLPKNKSHMSLNDAVVSETSGDYGTFMNYVTQTRGKFLANQLHKAMDGIGCNKALLNRCFTQSTSEDIAEMREVYENVHGKKLADVIRSELGGEHEKLILFLLKNGRPQDPADPSKAEQQKSELKDMIKNGGSMLGGLKDAAEEQVSKYIAAMSVKQCQEVKKVYGKFESTVKEKFSGALEEAVLQLIEETDVQYAQEVKKAMDGIGTDEAVLSRILGGNHKHVAAQIAATYFNKYDKKLNVALKEECGGHYLNAMLTWIRGYDAAGGLEPSVEYYRKQFLAGELAGAALDGYEGVLRAAVDNAKECIASLDCDLLKAATAGLGTDERMVVSILCTRTKAQLDAVDMLYRERYGRSLREYCECELSGDLEEFLTYTQMEEDECDAHMLREAFDGIGCNEAIVVEVLVGRSSERLARAREYYEKFYDENLMDRLRSELGEDLEKLCLTLMRGCRNRSENQPPLAPDFDAAAVAAALYKGGEAKWGTDEEAFIEVLCSHTQAELKAVAEVYDTTYNCSLEKAIQSEFSGDMEDALVGLLFHPSDLYCRLLHEAMAGIGANEATISRILGANDKKMVHRIAQRYFEKYDISLVDELSAELYFDYRKACMNYVSTSDASDGAEDRLVELEIAATDPPPKPPSKVPERPPPPPPQPKPEPPAASPAPAAPAPKGEEITPVYASSPQPVVIVFGVMDMQETRRQQQEQEARREAREREKDRQERARERERQQRQEHREDVQAAKRAMRHAERQERGGPSRRNGPGGGGRGGRRGGRG